MSAAQGGGHPCPVVIPAYNEAATIRDVVERALAQGAQVIVVDDGSTDGTSARLAGLPVTLLVNERNLGKAASIWRGAEAALAAGASGIVTLDGDGQHDPEELRRILQVAAVRPGAIVVGARLHAGRAIPLARYCANRFANFWIAWAAGRPIDDSQSGFRYYPAAVFRTLDVRHDRWASFVFESEVLIAAARAGIDILFVPVSVSYAASRAREPPASGHRHREDRADDRRAADPRRAQSLGAGAQPPAPARARGGARRQRRPLSAQAVTQRAADSAAAPALSLVVPAYNEADYLPALLASVAIARMRSSRGPVEVIVADNASSDATARVAADAGCRVVHVARRSIAAARNGGARDGTRAADRVRRRRQHPAPGHFRRAPCRARPA